MLVEIKNKTYGYVWTEESEEKQFCCIYKQKKLVN